MQFGGRSYIYDFQSPMESRRWPGIIAYARSREHILKKANTGWEQFHSDCTCIEYIITKRMVKLTIHFLSMGKDTIWYSWPGQLYHLWSFCTPYVLPTRALDKKQLGPCRQDHTPHYEGPINHHWKYNTMFPTRDCCVHLMMLNFAGPAKIGTMHFLCSA